MKANKEKMNKTIFNHVDCIRIYIPDLEKGLEYYNKKLGLQIAWKTSLYNQENIEFRLTKTLMEGNEC